MSSEYKFRIVDSYTPETLPMERLAEYMIALARMLGEAQNVHFDEVKAGSAVLVAKVDNPAQPKVRERVQRIQRGDAPPDALRAFHELDELLRKDNARGELLGEANTVIVPFPGRDRPEPVTFGPFRQEGSLDGQVIRVGGRDETVPVHLRDGAVIYSGLNATPELARRIAQHLLGPILRVHGTGLWFREGDGTWVLKKFKITDFDVLDDAPLNEVVNTLRRVKGSTWNEVPDPVRALFQERHENGGTS